MTSGTAGTADIRCPFFKSHGAMQITCEGVYRYSAITCRYQHAGAKDAVMRRRCESDYRRCPIYCMIMAYKYHETGGSA